MKKLVATLAMSAILCAWSLQGDDGQGQTSAVTTSGPVNPDNMSVVETSTSEPSSLPTSEPASSQPTTDEAESAPASEDPKDTLDKSRKLYWQGYFSRAERKLLPLVEKCKDDPAKSDLAIDAAIWCSRAMRMTGKYSKAVETLNLVSAAGAKRCDWLLERAEALADVGEYQKALDDAKASCELNSKFAQAIYVRGNLLEILGKTEDALAVYKSMDDIVSGDEYRHSAPTLVALGKILDRYVVLSGQKASLQAGNVLNNYLVRAERVDGTYWPADIAMGEFNFSKHQPVKTVEAFNSALKKVKVQNGLPDACVGLAACELEGWRFENCLTLTDAALRINPNHPGALIVKAACYMVWRKFDEVPPILEKVLKVNPNHPETLSLLAAAYIQLGKKDKADACIQTVLKTNPNCAMLYTTIGHWQSASRQYVEAEKQYLRALELDPKSAEAHTGIGMLYMEIGDESKARDSLKKAHELDDYRADVVNYLGLLDELVDPEKYMVRQTPHFTIKVSSCDDQILLDQVENYMEKTYQDVCGDFGYTPTEKTTIEIFPTHDTFSIRLTGRGWLPTVGASTGKVIVLAAPSRQRSALGTHDWATVLRHEFAHTVTMAATNNKIPRWYTEACAVWEQPVRRDYDATYLLVSATREGRLFPVKEIDWGFIRPKRRTDSSQAYAQSEWMLEYLIGLKGFGVVKSLLDAYRDEICQADVFKKALGMTEDEFDKQFAAWAKDQVKQWGYDPSPLPKLNDTTAEVRKNPEDAVSLANHAYALQLSGQKDQAEKYASKALGVDPDNVRALIVLAEIQVGSKKYPAAAATAAKLRTLDPKCAAAHRILAICMLEEKNWYDAIKSLETLKGLRPVESWSYEQLANLYVQLGMSDDAVPNLVELDRHTITDSKYARQVAEIYRAGEKNDQALSYFEKVIRIDPYDPSAYEAIAHLHLRAKRYDQAISAARSICLLEPNNAKSWALMAATYYRSGKARSSRSDLENGKKAAEKAIGIDADSTQARQVLNLIDSAIEAIPPQSSSAPVSVPISSPPPSELQPTSAPAN